MKRIKGYTLVELIIVIAIIGILSTVLIPNIINQVGKSKYRTAQSQAKSIFNSAQTILQKYEVLDRSITDSSKKHLQYGTAYCCGTISGTVTTGVSVEFYKDLKSMNTHLGEGEWVIVVKDYKVTHILWASTDTDRYVGIYCGDSGCTLAGHNVDYDDYRKADMKNISERFTLVKSKDGVI